MDRGWRYALAHPSEAARIVVPKLDNQDSLAQQTEEMKALARLASGPHAPVGSMTAARWQAGINLLLTYKQIPARVPVNQVFTTQFLPAGERG
jgi:ABC-type nitrate/sulfonate/bicarbonate transport system substrate-binding protein